VAMVGLSLRVMWRQSCRTEGIPVRRDTYEPLQRDTYEPLSHSQADVDELLCLEHAGGSEDVTIFEDQHAPRLSAREGAARRIDLLHL
jgi:hypothetical protein